jgi:hypothetical protein
MARPAVAALRRRHGEVVEPAAMAVPSRDDGGDHAAVLRADEKELRRDGELPPDDFARLVPRAGVGKDPRPQRHHVGFVRLAIGPDLQFLVSHGGAVCPRPAESCNPGTGGRPPAAVPAAPLPAAVPLG